MDQDMCKAISRTGVPLTIYAAGRSFVVDLRPGDTRYQICTRDQDHRGGHSSCDGRGHILASWPRSRPERYWHPKDCAGCLHHRRAVSQLN